MQLQNTEYGTGCFATKSGFADAIIISRKALEEWKSHYIKEAEKLPKDHPSYQFMLGLLKGKADVLIDLLKHFPEEK